jgi:hypothetical protein
MSAAGNGMVEGGVVVGSIFLSLATKELATARAVDSLSRF